MEQPTVSEEPVIAPTQEESAVTPDSSEVEAPTEPQQTDSEHKPTVPKTKVDEFIRMMKKIGFIMELRPETQTVLVNPTQWASYTYSEKENIVLILTNYSQYYCTIGGVIHVKDGYSGEEVAKGVLDNSEIKR